MGGSSYSLLLFLFAKNVILKRPSKIIQVDIITM